MSEISEDGYKKSLAVVMQYRQQFVQQFFSAYTCCSCLNNTIELHGSHSLLDAMKQENACWKNGVVFRIECGYGSKHDGSRFYAALCDECIAQTGSSGITRSIQEIQETITSKAMDKF